MNNLKIERIRSIEIIGAIFGIILGSMLHFTFELSGSNVFVGLFSAVNESVWEHTKLIVFPVMIFMCVEFIYFKNINKLLMAKVLEVLFGIFFIIAFFYAYTGIFKFESLWIDIASFFVAVILGKVISYKIITIKEEKIGYTFLHALVLVLIALFYFFVTFTPPRIPLFKDSNTNLYGIERL